MKISKNELPKGQLELVVEISHQELEPHLKQAVEEISKEVSISGFRPGKAPYAVLEKQVGAMRIYQHAADIAVRITFPQVVKQEELPTIGSPEITIEKVAPQNPFVYKAKVNLLPETKLGDYKNIKVKKMEVKVEPKELEEAMANLRKMMGKEKRVNRSAKKGDKVEIDMDTYVDKVPIDGGQSKGHPVEIGSGSFIPGFEDNLVSMKEGDDKEFNLIFPKEYHRKELAGRPVEFKVKMNSVFEIELPELNDDFVKQVGKLETLDDLKKQLENNLIQEKTAKEKQRWELAVIEKLIERSKFSEMPQLLIDSELHKMIHELEHQVQTQGMKFEDYLQSIKKSKDDLKKEFLPQAERRVKTALVVRKVSEQENIMISEKELEDEVTKSRGQYQGNEEMTKQFDTAEFREYLTSVMKSRKVFELFGKTN